MRDIALTLLVFGSLPIILRRPWIGVLMWTWISLMSPGRLTWGFAYNLPFAKAVALTTLVSLLLTKESKVIPWRPLVVVWAMFVVWMCITTAFALSPSDAWLEFDRMIKIQLFCFITLMLGGTKERLLAFVWVVALSIGFYGIKGGIFTIATGGAYLVWGPAMSFIEGNNEMAFALIVIIPLMRFLQLHTENKWISRGLGVSMVLCAISSIGSHSRGAFLAILCMGMFMFWKSRRRMMLIPALMIMVPIGLAMMPQKYWDRMNTIQSYEQDASAMGRINAWLFALNLVEDFPITGGGFRTFTPGLFRIYAPIPDDHHDVHSIYFEVLGEHGWPGFFLYMLLAFMAYYYAAWTIKRARGDPGLLWYSRLARMSQVCLVGYAVGGAFLGLAYFDLYYDILIIIVLNRILLEKQLGRNPAAIAPSIYGPQMTRAGPAEPAMGRTGPAMPGYGNLGERERKPSF